MKKPEFNCDIDGGYDFRESFLESRKTEPLPVRTKSDGCKPSHDDLFKFFEHSLNLFVEGVEFMTKDEIYHSIKAECAKVSNSVITAN